MKCARSRGVSIRSDLQGDERFRALIDACLNPETAKKAPAQSRKVVDPTYNIESMSPFQLRTALTRQGIKVPRGTSTDDLLSLFLSSDYENTQSNNKDDATNEPVKNKATLVPSDQCRRPLLPAGSITKKNGAPKGKRKRHHYLEETVPQLKSATGSFHEPALKTAKASESTDLLETDSKSGLPSATMLSVCLFTSQPKEPGGSQRHQIVITGGRNLDVTANILLTALSSLSGFDEGQTHYSGDVDITTGNFDETTGAPVMRKVPVTFDFLPRAVNVQEYFEKTGKTGKAKKAKRGSSVSPADA